MDLRNWLLVIFVCLVVPVVGFTQALQGARVRVIDGDSFEILVNDVKQDEVRLINIDAPELSQAYGSEAKAALAAMIETQSIRIVPNGVDQYGRKLAEIWVGELMINKYLVQTGAAWAFAPILQDPSFLPLQAQAKDAKLGLWALANPVAPWLYRDAARGVSTQPGGGVRLPRVIGHQNRPPRTSGFTGYCGTKKYCAQMSSCQEAQFYFSSCGVTSMDGDLDGRPCELICGS